jgi:hypothetical protein
MISKERKDFLWTVGALAVLIFVAMFGAYSGSRTTPNAECIKTPSAGLLEPAPSLGAPSRRQLAIKLSIVCSMLTEVKGL